jgi:hypothetical protein
MSGYERTAHCSELPRSERFIVWRLSEGLHAPLTYAITDFILCSAGRGI